MKKIIVTILLCVFNVIGIYAQQSFCGTDAARLIQLNNDPDFKQREDNVNQILFHQAIKSLEDKRRLMSATSYIPVVVHIVHQNGPENISDSDVIASINQLNFRFQNAALYTDSTGNNVGIQFCLASIDPWGNPTNGITRDVSSQTDLSLPTSNDFLLKNVNRWDPLLYLNIWVIKVVQENGKIYGGYAYLPGSLGQQNDGIVERYNVLNSEVTTHEVGHYLGLYHTFNGVCANFNCLLNGDYVCDTPPDASDTTYTCPQNSCSTEMNDTSGFNSFIADVNDLPNYMDYTSCPLSFTLGQSDRMNASLGQIRTLLLQSNGCGQHPGGTVPTASFTATPACGGIILSNTSLNSISARWDYDGDGIVDYYGNSFKYNPLATGSYAVKLYAQGIGGIDTITQIIFAQYYPYQNYPLINGYLGLRLSASGQINACAGETLTFQGEPGMAHYYWTNGDTTQNSSFTTPTTPFVISLTTIDSAGLVWSVCYPVSVNTVPAPTSAVVSIAPGDSTFCIGNPINLLITYSPIWLNSQLYYYQGNLQGFHDSTYSTSLNSFNAFWIYQTDTNGCISRSNIITVIGSDVSLPGNISNLGGNLLDYPAGNHHEWYFNGTPILNSDYELYTMTQIGCYRAFSWWADKNCGTFSLDSVCISAVGLQQNTFENSMIIYPNPATSQLTIESIDYKIVSINMYDVVGQEVNHLIINKKQTTIDLSNVQKGIYFLKIIDSSNRVINKKITLQ